MIKFMRKHNKKLLAIFTAGLLIVWLGSQALEEMLKRDTSKASVGKAFGKEFERRDRHQANVKIEVLSSLHIPWSRPWGFGLENLPIKPVDPLTWFLLDLEARHYGVEVPHQEVERLLTAARIPGNVLEMIRDRQGISIDRIKDCIADYMRIERVGHLAAGVGKVSQPEVAHFVRDTRERITVRMAMLRAGDFSDPNGAVDAPALEKQFHQFKNEVRGTGRQGYGYRWPDRIRVEYLEADVGKIEKALTITRDEAYEYWRNHMQEFTKEVPVTSGPSSGPATGAVSRPASTGSTTRTASTTASAPTTSTKPATESKRKTFDEAQADVVAELRKQRAPALAEKIIREATQRIMEPWYDVAPDAKTGYKAAPPGVDAPEYLEKIAAEVCKRNALPADVLRVVKPGRWLSREEAAGLEGIGKAAIEGQSPDEEQPSRFVDIAFHVQNLYEMSRTRRGVRGLALHELFNTPLRDTKDGAPYNYYVFRVVGAQKEHAPETIDEVKDAVRKDLIEMAGYKRAGEQATALLAAAKDKGLEAAVKAAVALQTRLGEKGLANPEPFSRRRSFGQAAMQFGLPLTMLWPIEELGVTEEKKIGFLPMQVVAAPYEAEVETFIETCFRLAPPVTSAPATASSSRPAEKVGLVEMPRSKQWVVVEFIAVERVNAADFAKVMRQAQMMLQTDRTINFLKSWYDPEQVKKRVGYVPAHEDQEG